jgi:hypothetical protein
MPALRALVLNIRRVSLNVICRTHDPWRNTNNTPQFLACFPPSPHPYTNNTAFRVVGPEQITDGSTDDVYSLRPRHAQPEAVHCRRCHGNRMRSLGSVHCHCRHASPVQSPKFLPPASFSAFTSLSHQLICPQRSSHSPIHTQRLMCAGFVTNICPRPYSAPHPLPCSSDSSSGGNQPQRGHVIRVTLPGHFVCGQIANDIQQIVEHSFEESVVNHHLLFDHVGL